MSDPYAVLGVARTATDEQIREAAKSLVFRWHPDRKHGDALKLAEVNFAREVLIDPKRRALFNEFGPASFAPMFNEDNARAARMPQVKMPANVVDLAEVAGGALGKMREYLKTDDGQKTVIKGLQTLPRLQTEEGAKAYNKAALGFAKSIIEGKF